MNKSILKEKSFKFSVRIVNLYKFVIKEHHEFVLSKQLLRIGTAIGAMIREAEFGQSKLDFIHKLSIAQKEANETLYWLELLRETDYLTQLQFESMHSEIIELLKLITASIKTAKKNLSEK